MLCGYLPFHSSKNNKQELCHKILRGSYSVPDFLSGDAADLLKRMLTVHPEKRITLAEMMQHRWITRHLAAHKVHDRSGGSTSPTSPFDTSEIDEDRIQWLERSGVNRRDLEEYLEQGDTNYLTTAYHLLGQHRWAQQHKREQLRKAQAKANAVAAANEVPLDTMAATTAEPNEATWAAPVPASPAAASPQRAYRPTSAPVRVA